MGRSTVQDRYVKERSPSHFCKTCGKATRERKPFCSTHVLNDGYAKRIYDIVLGVEHEIQCATKHGPSAVDVDGKVSEEILAGIASAGEVTWRRLVKDQVAFLNNVSAAVADVYLVKLRKAGLVKIHLTARNSEVVTLTRKGIQKVRKRTT